MNLQTIKKKHFYCHIRFYKQIVNDRIYRNKLLLCITLPFKIISDDNVCSRNKKQGKDVYDNRIVFILRNIIQMAGFHQSGATNFKSRALMSISTSRYAVALSFRSESKPQSVTSWSSSAAANGPPQTSADKVFTLFCELGIRIPAGYLRDLPTHCCSYFVIKESRFSFRRVSNPVIYNTFTSRVFFF